MHGRIFLTLVSVALALAPKTEAGFNVSTFEDQGLPANSFNNNAGASGQFVSGGNAFLNSYDSSFGGIWSGFAVSSTTDTTTAGYTNQYSAIAGSGANGSQTYGVGFTFGGNVDPFHPDGSVVNLAAGQAPYSVQVTNTTYDYLSMLNGDSFAKKFGAGDFLMLTIAGYDSSGGVGNKVGEVDFYLANFLGSDSSKYYIVNTWQTVDLGSLAGSSSLRFGLESSDNDPNVGMNTPAYFALDNLTTGTGTAAVVPEPASLVLLATGLIGLVGFGRTGRRAAASVGACLFAFGNSGPARADFDPQVGQPGSLGIAKSGGVFTEWASSVDSFTRGPQDISNPNSPPATFGTPSNALGNNDLSSVVSLGDGGSITLGFARPIANGAGADFAVFENGFLSGSPGLAYLELAVVDVSSDGVHFFRFAPTSLTQSTTQVGAFGLLDASKLNNLAGKYIGGYGTGFDLSELAGVSPLLDINHVTEVRITDVVGSIDPRYGTRDSLGNLINDPFTTPFASSGFDLNGIGVIHMDAATAVPEPSSLLLSLAGIGVGAVGFGRARTASDSL